MARTARASRTFYDVTDGVTPITIKASNENHSFAASSDGTVASATRTMFSSLIRAYLGQTLLTYSTNTATANTYRVTSATYEGSPTGWGTPDVSSTGTITIPSISATAAENVIINVIVSVTNAASQVTTGLPLEITLSVIKQGAGGASISLAANKDVFNANNAGTLEAGQDPVILAVTSLGTTGAISFATSLDGGNYITRSNTGAGQGFISGYDTDASGSFTTSGAIPSTGVARVQITQENVGNLTTLSIRAQGDTGGADFVTITKLRAGSNGASSLYAVIDVPQGDVFRNNETTDKVATARVFDQATGTEITGSTVSYNWQRTNSAGTAFEAVRVTSSSNRTVIDGSGGVEANGVAFPSITIGDEDVTGRRTYDCTITVSDS